MKLNHHSLFTLTLIALLATFSFTARGQHVLLEAEQFADTGGWDVDQQFMDQMGSPYLLAHGLGVPVRDAETTAKFPAPGKYRVWVRTRDWVAPWNAPGAPGRFQVLVNGKPLAAIFGTEGAEWHWQDGGSVEVAGRAKVALHDLTGFEGRCDAVLFSKDAAFNPPSDLEVLAKFRRTALGLPEEPEDGGTFDLVVVGGGIAGTSAAVSAARNGLKVALVQDRPVLGGNGSSEVRVWPEGKTQQAPFRHIGDIVEELVAQKTATDGNAKGGQIYADGRKLDVVRSEPRITLLTEQRVFAVVARAGRIQSVVAQHIRTARRLKISGKFFADCTGDATVGFLAGAAYEVSSDDHMGASNLWNVMDVADPKQVLVCECKDKTALAMAAEAGQVAAPFPRCPWAVDLSDKPFPGRKTSQGQWGGKDPLSNLGGWFWESGFCRDPINDMERIRDLNFRAMYGAWDTLKNVDKLYPNHRLGWAAFIAGKRESRRLLGDVKLSGDDFREGRRFPDGCFPCSWHIDIHTPNPTFAGGHKGDEFIAVATTGKGYSYQGIYWAPYRCLYSTNIANLFMAGRDISVDREALGPVRVMRTTGMMGEVVGKAAWIAVRHQTTPRGVYEQFLALLKELMTQPGALRRATLDGPLVLPPGVTLPARALPGLDPAKLEGIVIDDEDAELRGNWSDQGSLRPFVGQNYHYSSDAAATARFAFEVKTTGLYEVRVAWQPHDNRAKAVPITVTGADGEKTFTIDQTKPAQGANGFQALGAFRFNAGQKAAVIYRVAGPAAWFTSTRCRSSRSNKTTNMRIADFSPSQQPGLGARNSFRQGRNSQRARNQFRAPEKSEVRAH